jgi:hypothetical protein
VVDSFSGYIIFGQVVVSLAMIISGKFLFSHSTMQSYLFVSLRFPVMCLLSNSESIFNASTFNSLRNKEATNSATLSTQGYRFRNPVWVLTSTAVLVFISTVLGTCVYMMIYP